MTGDEFLKQLMTLPAVVMARLSPDGRYTAFMWARAQDNVDVFVVPSDGSQPPIALTRTPEYTSLVGWTADSRAVIVDEDHDGDERTRLFRVDLDAPLVMKPLTEDRPPYFIRGGSLSPDGAALFYGANHDFEHGETIEPTWVYRHDLASGERTVLARPQKPGYMEVSLNRQGSHLLYSRKDRHPSGRQFHLVDVEGGEDREILNFGSQAKVFARWFPDGENILVLSESTGGAVQNYNSLGVYHWPTRQMRWLVDDPQRSIEGAWVSPDGVIVVDEIRQAVHRPTWIDPAGGVETPFPSVQGSLLALGRAPDGAWVAIHTSATAPTDLVRLEPGASTPTSLTRVWERTGLKPGDLTPAESLNWLSVDGETVQGWLYRARPNPGRAILYVHGGPSSHSEDKLNPQIQYYVRRGFNVLDVNYRGSTGFGLRYRELIKVDGWGGREQDDIAAAADALILLQLAQPGRVGVTGTSYGGYSAWRQITGCPPEVIAAAAPICGMTDLVVDYETTRPDLRPLSEEMMGGRPDQVPEKYRQRSPLHFVENIRGRLLIVQGGQDPNVTPENVRVVRQRLDENHIPYELLVFDDEGHGIMRPANQEILYTRLADFFEVAFQD